MARPMAILFTSGVRVDALTIDPARRAAAAFWTHRPARRVPAGRVLASTVLAATWPGALGLPIGAGAVAMGQRMELIPSGYGPGGAALLLTQAGHRTLIVGPTTRALVPRAADRLVLCAPAQRAPEAPWLERAQSGEASLRLVVPDGAAAAVVCDGLTEAGIAHFAPAWLTPRGPRARGARVTVATGGQGVHIDARPQADEAWLVSLARFVGPEITFVHGPRADAVAAQLAAVGLATRVLHAPKQMSLGGLDGSERRPPSTGAPWRRLPVSEDEVRPEE